MNAPSHRVTIERERRRLYGDADAPAETVEWFVVSDEFGEFAMATTIEQALRYAADLLHGPSTGVPSADRP